MTRVLADGYSIDASWYSLAYCKFSYYIQYIFMSLSSWYLILACMDRYASSSQHLRLRQFSSLKIAYHLIPTAIVVCCLIYVHMPIYFEIKLYQVSATQFVHACYGRSGVYKQFFNIFYVTIYCCLPPLCMIVFACLTYHNVKQIRRQVVPSSNNQQLRRMKQRDYQMIQMLLFQITLTILLTLPIAITVLYTTCFGSDVIQNFILKLATYLLYISFISNFYINTLSTKTYRYELYTLLNELNLYLFRSSIIARHFSVNHAPTTHGTATAHMRTITRAEQ
ncbi:unnamed protein product [Didymodactylos carnosus]|uniref:G-protein coupled receptors family 1 profile domain-containing protein n=1 Tax=Didymodactylos carnosus TaxID=1234261 RepID=A0A814HTY7_9BILA|nr:unnamed protein product [Didymodactylos carnosus]CAF3784573.1 unnamed protein product [Didymodactylos carnosus]